MTLTELVLIRRGRLCSAEYTQNGVTFSDCTTAANPDGVAGKEWCAVEPGLAGSDWAYCAPKIDYGAMRSAAEVGFAAKAEESHRSIMSGGWVCVWGCSAQLGGFAERRSGRPGRCSSSLATSRLRSSNTTRPVESLRRFFALVCCYLRGVRVKASRSAADGALFDTRVRDP